MGVAEKLVTSLPCIQEIKIHNGQTTITIEAKDIFVVMQYLKLSSDTRYEQLIDITAVDYPSQARRFHVIYQLLSVSKQHRIGVKVQVDALTAIHSIVEIYPSAGWFERETWDMFGVFFYNHPDLRRILSDYGFMGYPLRKDFPLSGYYQVRYSDEKKRVVSEPLELAQSGRIFNYPLVWR